MLRPPRDKSWLAYYAAVGRDAVTSAQQFALAVTFLPHQAVVCADAIVRTLIRLLVTQATSARVADGVAGRAGDACVAARSLATHVAGRS